MQGSKLTKNSSRDFGTEYQNVVAIQQNLRTAFPVSGLAKQNMSPQFLCVKETAENGKRKTKLFLYLTPCSKEVTSSD